MLIILKIIKKREKRKEGLYTSNKEMAKDEQYFYDKTFDNVKYYENEYEEEEKERKNEIKGRLIKTGMEKCKKECKGKCVEYGITGNAYCFK